MMFKQLLVLVFLFSECLVQEQNSWSCNLPGHVKDWNEEPLSGVEVTVDLYNVEEDHSEDFLKSIPLVKTDENGKYLFQFELSKSLVTVAAKLKFVYKNQKGEKQELKKVQLLQGQNYFGGKELKVIFPYKADICGTIKNKKSGVAIISQVRAKSPEGEIVTAETDSQGNYKLQIPIKPNKPNKIEIIVTPKDQSNYQGQEFDVVLDEQNQYEKKNQKLDVLEKNQVDLKGKIDGWQKTSANKKAKIQVGEGQNAKVYQVDINDKGEYDTVVEVTKQQFDKNDECKIILISQNGDKFGKQENTIKKEKQAYDLPPLKLTNKLSVQIKLKQVLEENLMSIKDEKITIEGNLAGKEFKLEQSSGKQKDYQYVGSVEVERKGEKLSGKIVVKKSKYYESFEDEINLNIKNLEALKTNLIINRIKLKPIRKDLLIKGEIANKDKGKVDVKIECDKCKQKIASATAEVDKQGKFTINVKKGVELGKQQKVKVVVSSDSFERKEFVKVFNGEPEKLEEFEKQEWKFEVVDKRFLVLKGSIEDRIGGHKLDKAKVIVDYGNQKIKNGEAIADENGEFELIQEGRLDVNSYSVEIQIIPHKKDDYFKFTDKFELNIKNQFKVEKKYQLLKKNEVCVSGNVVRKEKVSLHPVKNAEVFIKFKDWHDGDSIRVQSDEKGKFEICQKVNFEFKKGICLAKIGNLFGKQEITLIENQQSYKIQDMKMTDKFKYTLKIQKIQDEDQKEMEDKNLKATVIFNKDNIKQKFELERKTYKNNEFKYYYEKTQELKRIGDKLKGDVIINGLQDFKELKNPIEIDLAKLEEFDFEQSIKSLTLERQKYSIILQGLVQDEKQKFSNVKIQISIICENCKKQNQQILDKTIKTNSEGKYNLKIDDKLEKGRKYKIKVTASSNLILTKTKELIIDDEKSLKQLEKGINISTEKQTYGLLKGTIKLIKDGSKVQKGKVKIIFEENKVEQKEVDFSEGEFEVKVKLSNEIQEYKGSIEIIPENKDRFNEIKEQFTINKQNSFVFAKDFELITKGEIYIEGECEKEGAKVEIKLRNSEKKTQEFSTIVKNGEFKVTEELKINIFEKQKTNKGTLVIRKENYIGRKEFEISDVIQKYSEGKIAMTNEFLYKVRINSILNEFKEDLINNQNLMVTAILKDKENKKQSFRLEKKTNKNLCYYYGEKQIKRSGELLKGEIEVSGIQKMEKQSYEVSVDLQKLDENEASEIVEKIVVNQKRSKIEFLGIVTRQQDNKKQEDVNIDIEYECLDCTEQQKENFKNILDDKTDQSGQYKLAAKLLIGQEYKINYELTKDEMITVKESITKKISENDYYPKGQISKDFLIKQAEKQFQLQIKGKVLNQNKNQISGVRLLIQALSKKDENLVLSSKKIKTKENGQFEIKLGIKQTIEEEVIIKISTRDTWMEKNSIKKTVKLDKIKQEKKEIQEIVQNFDIVLKACKEIKIIGRVINKANEKEEAIQDAKVKVSIKNLKNQDIKQFNAKSSENGEFELKIEDKWFLNGIDYEIEATGEKELYSSQTSQKLTVKTIKSNDIFNIGDILLQNNLIKRNIKIKGIMIDKSNEKELEGIEMILMVKKLNQWKEQQVKAKSDKKGTIELLWVANDLKNQDLQCKVLMNKKFFKSIEKKFIIKMDEQLNDKEFVKDFNRIEIDRLSGKLSIKGKAILKDKETGISNARIIAQLISNQKEEASLKGVTNNKGEFSIEGNAKQGIEYQIKIKGELEGYESAEQERQVKIDKDVILIEGFELRMNMQSVEIDFKVIGKVQSRQTEKKLKGASIGLKCKYQKEREVEESLRFKDVVSDIQGLFEFSQQMQIVKDSLISCEMTLNYQKYEQLIKKFDLTKEMNYQKNFEKIELNYDFPETSDYQNVFGIITRLEQCGNNMIKNPVSNCKIKLIFKDYDSKPLVYKELKSNANGKFEIQVPVFPFTNYYAQIYIPYQQIPNNEEDAYVAQTLEFLVKGDSLGNSINLGNIVLSNRRDHPFECSIQERAAKKKFQQA